MHFTVIQVVATLIAFLAQFSRIFSATKPFWGKLPAVVQVWLPPILPFAAALQASLAGVASWTDFSVALIVSAALLLPGAPSNRSSAPLQEGKAPTLSPSSGDVAVASALMAKASVRPLPLGDDDKTPPTGPWNGPSSGIVALLIAVCFAAHSSACGLFGSSGSFWPKVERCAPSPANLVGKVIDVLLAGGDYESALAEIGKTDGYALVECAVQVAVSELTSKIGAKAGPEAEADAVGAARGKAFLAKVSK